MRNEPPRPERLDRLQQMYGKEIELASEDGGGSEQLRLLAEYRVGDNVYAALQTAAMRKADEIAFFQVLDQEDALVLEEIADEDEWEAAAEAFDDLMFEESASE